MYPESTFTKPSDICPHPERWSAADTDSSEQEVGDFIHGLIRLLKPNVVVETGCYLGDTSEKIVLALNLNKYGSYYFCDTNSANVEKTIARLCPAGGVRYYPNISTGVELISTIKTEIDLAFIDSGYIKERSEEIRYLVPKMNRYGVILLHDTAPHHTYSAIHNLLELPKIYFNTPRGLSLFQCP